MRPQESRRQIRGSLFCFTPALSGQRTKWQSEWALVAGFPNGARSRPKKPNFKPAYVILIFKITVICTHSKINLRTKRQHKPR